MFTFTWHQTYELKYKIEKKYYCSQREHSVKCKCCQMTIESFAWF